MSKHKRRSIVVEGETYQWLVTNDVVYVWHPKMGRKWWLRHRHPEDYRFDWDSIYDPVTPRDVVLFIYREYLLRAPPPRPRPVLPSRPRPKTLVPIVNTAQPEIYALVRVVHWFDEETGRHKTRDETVAAFTDPQMAKVQAERLNPPHAESLRTISWEALRDRFGDMIADVDRMIDHGFILWKAIAVPLYDVAK
jgi:hypothetical protein